MALVSLFLKEEKKKQWAVGGCGMSFDLLKPSVSLSSAFPIGSCFYN